MMKKVLTIAGSDSGGGAGIQADLKTFTALGTFGMSAITALTAQNTVGVQGIFELSPEFVAKQIDTVMSDIGADAWKTGMLANSEIVHLVAEKCKEYEIELMVVDPVMIAKSGDALLKPEAQKTLIAELIPLSFVLTPNHHEAEEITGIKIGSLKMAKKAAQEIYDLGAENVIIKGGHLPKSEDAVDVLFDGNSFHEIRAPRIDTENTHGTGCTYASAIAAELAKGNEIVNAVKIAKTYLTEAIQLADKMNIGQGHGPLNHMLGGQVEF
jgi:hydroxymethylpyrimidine/phosphomethylpyrimidine kinase